MELRILTVKKKTNQKAFWIEKVIKRKGDKPYFKLKGYDNSFNCWIDKNDICIKNELFTTLQS